MISIFRSVLTAPSQEVQSPSDGMQNFGIKFSFMIFYIILYPSHCFETRDLNIYLNMDGSVAADSIMPSCGTDNKIRLLSYNYCRIKCHFSTGCYTEHEEPLSPDARFLLHKMCSWKDRCSNLAFPLRSVGQVNVTNAINIKYRCLAHRHRYINICEKVEKNFTNTVYLISDETAKYFQECYCFVSKGTFSIGIVDLRLSQKKGMLCSSAVLLINSKEFKCDSEKNDFGAIFNKNNIESTSNAFLSLKLNSLSAIPDKMVISLTPEAVAKIHCFRKKLSSGDIQEESTVTSEIHNLWTFTSNVESVTRESVLSTVTSSRNQAADNVPCGNVQVWLVAIGQGVTMVLMVLTGSLLFYRRYLYLKKKWKNKWLSEQIALILADNNPNLADLCDINRPNKFAEKFSQLYDNEWTNAFEKLKQKEGFEEDKIAIKQLLDIVMESFRFCTEKSKTQLDLIMETFDIDKEVQNRLQELYSEFEGMVKDEAFQKYVDRCIALSWLMAVQDPPMAISIAAGEDRRFAKTKFREYTKAGEAVDYVVWPCILSQDGGSVMSKGVVQCCVPIAEETV